MQSRGAIDGSAMKFTDTWSFGLMRRECGGVEVGVHAKTDSDKVRGRGRFTCVWMCGCRDEKMERDKTAIGKQ